VQGVFVFVFSFATVETNCLNVHCFPRFPGDVDSPRCCYSFLIIVTALGLGGNVE
jgi:hypothetical protein